MKLCEIILSNRYSINRIKGLMRAAEGKKSQRAATCRIRCKQWLGIWR